MTGPQRHLACRGLHEERPSPGRWVLSSEVSQPSAKTAVWEPTAEVVDNVTGHDPEARTKGASRKRIPSSG